MPHNYTNLCKQKVKTQVKCKRMKLLLTGLSVAPDSLEFGGPTQ